MPDAVDIDKLLQTGQWTTSPDSRTLNSSPRRAQRSAQVDDPRVPRTFGSANMHLCFPPKPSVEDEAESLAKEHGTCALSIQENEEPKCRGDVEQMPILLPVPEYNQERRFVIVPSSNPLEHSDSDDACEANVAPPPPREKSQSKGEYEANTCRKFTVPGLEMDDAAARRPSQGRRKSRQDLPPIETDIRNDRASPNSQRTQSAAHVDQRPRDYNVRQDSQGTPMISDGYLSPSIIKHSTKGRDRAYFDLNPGGSHGSCNRPKSPQLDKYVFNGKRGTQPPSRSTKSSSPTDHRRSSSFAEKNKNIRDSPGMYNGRRSDDPLSARSERRNLSPPASKRGKSSPPPLYRKRADVSPPRGHPERDRLHRRNSSYKRRSPSPPRQRDDFDGPPRRRPSLHKHRSVNGEQEDSKPRPGLESSRPLGPREKSQPPLASPRVSQNQLPEGDIGISPRASATFPQPKEKRRQEDRPVSPFSSGGSPPRTAPVRKEEAKPAGPRPHSQAPSVKSVIETAVPLAVPAAMGAAQANSTEVKKPLNPPPPVTVSCQNSTESNSPQQNWPPRFDPSRNGAPNGGSLEKPIESYRRYSEDVGQGTIPTLPDCPRQIPQKGHNDWLTFSQAKHIPGGNFNICPSCYTSMFANSDFRTQFMPAPLRSADKAVACDMGASPWFRIAWLMTLKHGYHDLRLLHNIASTTAKADPCSGDKLVTRTWYFIRDPYNNRLVLAFNVCLDCVKKIEALFPNLVGIFLPLDTQPEPLTSVCAFHFTPERKRFVKYFDLLETASDKAVATHTAPNISKLAVDLREILATDECLRDETVPDTKWHMMESVTGFTVCAECFDEVVWPELEGSSDIARNFYRKKQLLPLGACQLYSQRMRDVFRRACRRNDLNYLESKIRERQEVEVDIKSRIGELNPDHPSGTHTAEAERLLLEWKMWE